MRFTKECIEDTKQKDCEYISAGVPSHHFKWRTKSDKFILISEMETSHLFNTLRMVWNNTMPSKARIGKVKLYTFPEFYTHEYLKTACTFILRELETRDDMKDYMKDEVYQMKAYFIKKLKL